MAKVDIERELLDTHTDEELIAYLYKVMNGVVQNYQTALKANQPETLWSNLGDVSMVTAILRAIKARNDEIEARKQSMI